MTQSPLMITAALPYANGDIHLGHLVEYIQADIASRAARAQGRETLFLCGSDAHGTPIMLKAAENNESPESLTERVRKHHQEDLAAFHLAFDNFYTTHSPENKELVSDMYQTLKDKGHIIRQSISQAYDEEHGMFLPDRYVRGICPKCKAEDQYGDNCEACGASYSSTELVDPRSILSGKPPIHKKSEHVFLALEPLREFLTHWLDAGALPERVSNKLKEWFKETLRPWDISRDAPYFGFPIPGETDKFFYVWMDAPIGYIASFKQLADNNPNLKLDMDRYWGEKSDVTLYQFIGKDIAYFHGLFWPAVLHATEKRLPTKLFVHGYLTLNNEKMSKSRGTFITARNYLTHLNPDCLRYYYAAKLSNNADDIDLNLEDFRLRVNADLVGKYINIASRCAGFLRKHFNNTLSSSLDNPELLEECLKEKETIANLYDTTDYARAIRLIMSLADRVNQYIDANKPWALAKIDPQDPKVQAVCSMGVELFRVLSIYLAPVIPHIASQVKDFLSVENLAWDSLNTPLLNHRIADFSPLLSRVTPEQVEALLATANETS